MSGEGLRDHTVRVLAGTGLDPDSAAAAAAGDLCDLPVTALTAAAAMRDGWDAANAAVQAGAS